MKTLRPPVAFALGLWLGGLVAGAIGWMWFLSWQSSGGTGPAITAVTAGDQELPKLRADNAHLTSENARLRETLESYRQEFEEAPVTPASTGSVATATSNGKAPEAGKATLAQLEERALQNDVTAVTALGEASPSDHGEALLRVWASRKLDLPCQRTAIWYVGNQMESNPKLTDAIRALFAEAEADPELWLSALDGLTTAAPVTTDYRTRVNLLVELEDTAAPTLRPQIENARKRLLREWAESEGTPHR